MKQESNGGQRWLLIAFTLTMLTILCSPSFGQILESDTVICEKVSDYKSDNVMISYLLNEVDQCSEVDSIQSKRIGNLQDQLTIQKSVSDTLESSLVIVSEELETSKKRFKVALIGFLVSTVAFVVK